VYRAAIDGLRERAVQILAELAARSPAGYSFEERNGLLFASDHGLALQGTQRPAIPKSHDDVMAMCRRGLRSGALAMLEPSSRRGAMESAATTSPPPSTGRPAAARSTPA